MLWLTFLSKTYDHVYRDRLVVPRGQREEELGNDCLMGMECPLG